MIEIMNFLPKALAGRESSSIANIDEDRDAASFTE